MKLEIPLPVSAVLAALEERGIEAYLVGGCVRDSLLDAQPSDWDVAAGATPDTLLDVFCGWQAYQTGLAHGTLTVLSAGEPVEITAFRHESSYSDRRHPDSVRYGASLRDDLSRRDFTVNAMAYSPCAGLIDPFGGAEDLKKRLIRCVGDPLTRFGEDALRIMRALRLSAQLGFSLAPDTAAGLDACTGLLHEISPQRIAKELNLLIVRPMAGNLFLEHPGVLAYIADHFSGRRDASLSRFCVSLDACPPILSARLCLLFRAAEYPEKVMKRLGYSNARIAEVSVLCRLADLPIPDGPVGLKHWLRHFGPHAVTERIRMEAVLGGKRLLGESALDALDQILSAKEPYSLEMLCIGGGELIASGVVEPGPAVGKLLDRLLERVIEDPSLNEPRRLLKLARLSAFNRHTSTPKIL